MESLGHQGGPRTFNTNLMQGLLVCWRRQWHPTLVLGKSHGWKSLVGCGPWGREESDTTDLLHFHFSLFTFMHWRRKWQPTCLENPRDEGAWWAAVYGVAQSWTRLKWLSFSFFLCVCSVTAVMFDLLRSQGL